MAETLEKLSPLEVSYSSPTKYYVAYLLPQLPTYNPYVALSGNLMVLNPLDYDAHTRNYTLTITVSDLGVPPLSSSTFITVCVLDVNDNAPMFAMDSTAISVPENSPRGYQVHQFVITDPDNAPYNTSELNIMDGNDAGVFYINTSTNTLHVNNSGLLDFESPVKSYTLTVQAVDNLPDVNGMELDNTASVSHSKP